MSCRRHRCDSTAQSLDVVSQEVVVDGLVILAYHALFQPSSQNQIMHHGVDLPIE